MNKVEKFSPVKDESRVIFRERRVLNEEFCRSVILRVEQTKRKLFRKPDMVLTLCKSYRDRRFEEENCDGCVEFDSCKVDYRIKKSPVFKY